MYSGVLVSAVRYTLYTYPLFLDSLPIEAITEY